MYQLNIKIPLTLLLVVSSADNFCKQFGSRSGPTCLDPNQARHFPLQIVKTLIRPDKTSGLIWIQTVCYWWYSPTNVLTKVNFEKSLQTNSSDPDQARQTVGHDLNLNCLSQMAFPKDLFLKKLILKEKRQQMTKMCHFVILLRDNVRIVGSINSDLVICHVFNFR